jgi:hypothetical protein
MAGPAKDKDHERIGCLKDYTSDCKNKELKSFTAAHGRAFLVHHGPIGKLKEPIKKKKTLAVEGGDVDEYFDPREDFLVFEVRKRPGSGGGDEPIRLGRDHSNDVIIPDASISAVHAFFQEGPEAYTLVDNDSMNGTFVNMKEVPVIGRGDPLAVKSLSRLRFGSVVMTFMLAPDFYKLAREFF